MSFLHHLPSLPAALILVLLTSFIPTASASNAAAGRVNTAGFWISFCFVVVVSAAESVGSFFWTRYRVVTDGRNPCELSCRVCGREVSLDTIDAATASKVARDGLPVGCHSGNVNSSSYSMNGVVVSSSSSGGGCSTCGGFERIHTEGYGGTTEVVIDKFGSITMMPGLMIRRFNPETSLQAPAGLVDNIKGLVKPDADMTVGRMLERVVHLLVGIADLALGVAGVAGLAFNARSPQKLYDTLKDPKAPMTFSNYSTLFLLYWLLGLLLLLCMIPLRSKRRSIQMFGWPGAIAFVVAALVSLVLFALGCWKIDYARRNGLPWTPMLSYWIGGASAISFAPLGVEVFHTFGVVGLVFMLIHIF